MDAQIKIERRPCLDVVLAEAAMAGVVAFHEQRHGLGLAHGHQTRRHGGGAPDPPRALPRGRGLHSFPSPLNWSLLCPPNNQNQPVDVSQGAQVEF